MFGFQARFPVIIFLNIEFLLNSKNLRNENLTFKMASNLSQCFSVAKMKHAT